MNSISLKAYAKINIGLDVTGKLPDGYHLVKMIMQNIDLYDEVVLTENASGDIRLDMNVDFLPTDERNLAYKAAKLMKEDFGIDRGIDIYIRKNIPAAAGMAGGSTDAAAVMTGMNKLFDLNIDRNILMEHGLKLGADVPYCIMGGTALAEGIGEKLTQLSPCPDCYVLVAKPDISVSTAYVYTNLVLDDTTVHPDIDMVRNALESGDIRTAAKNMGNLLENVTQKEYPVIAEIKHIMDDNGALGSLMSGSGPTVFGLFDDYGTASECLAAVDKSDKAKDIHLVKVCNGGME